MPIITLDLNLHTTVAYKIVLRASRALCCVNATFCICGTAVVQLCQAAPPPLPFLWGGAALPTGGLPSGDPQVGFIAVEAQLLTIQLCLFSGISP